MAKDAERKTQHTERAHRLTGAKGPRKGTHNTTHQADNPVNLSQVATDTAHDTKQTERAHR